VIDQQGVEIGEVLVIVRAIAEPDQRGAQLLAIVPAKPHVVSLVPHFDLPDAFR
jgi:hypothetical protein